MTDPDTEERHVHRQRFDGDDPYLICDCGARWDALSGAPILAAAPQPAEPGLTVAEGDRLVLAAAISDIEAGRPIRAGMRFRLMAFLLAALALALDAEPAGLDAAWAEAETALPEGFVMDGVRRLYDNGVPEEQWIARAVWPYVHNAAGTTALEFTYGDTPAAALLALAARLRDRSE